MLFEENRTTMFVTVFYAVFNPRTGALTYSNAGHEPPVLRRNDGSTEVLPTTGGVALGIVEDMQYEERSIELARDELAYLFTDGVTEALNEAGEEFGSERLHAAIAGLGAGPARENGLALVRAVGEFAGEAEQFDDLTCLVLRTGAPPQ